MQPKNISFWSEVGRFYRIPSFGGARGGLFGILRTFTEHSEKTQGSTESHTDY
jgi:hypothetical protein